MTTGSLDAAIRPANPASSGTVTPCRTSSSSPRAAVATSVCARRSSSRTAAVSTSRAVRTRSRRSSNRASTERSARAVSVRASSVGQRRVSADHLSTFPGRCVQPPLVTRQVPRSVQPRHPVALRRSTGVIELPSGKAKRAPSSVIRRRRAHERCATGPTGTGSTSRSPDGAPTGTWTSGTAGAPVASLGRGRRSREVAPRGSFPEIRTFMPVNPASSHLCRGDGRSTRPLGRVEHHGGGSDRVSPLTPTSCRTSSSSLWLWVKPSSRSILTVASDR